MGLVHQGETSIKNPQNLTTPKATAIICTLGTFKKVCDTVIIRSKISFPVLDDNKELLQIP